MGLLRGGLVSELYPVPQGEVRAGQDELEKGLSHTIVGSVVT